MRVKIDVAGDLPKRNLPHHEQLADTPLRLRHRRNGQLVRQLLRFLRTPRALLASFQRMMDDDLGGWR